MWPPLETAVKLFDNANMVLIASLVIGVLATCIVVWMGNVKEDYLKHDLAATNERAAQANERAARLEKEAAALKESAEAERLARVKIEERIAWRRVGPTLYKRFLKELTPFAGSIINLNPLGNGDPETGIFTEDIAKLMRAAHWEVQIATGNVQIPVPVGLICRVDDQTPAGRALIVFLRTFPDVVILPPTQGSRGVVADITVGVRPPP